MIPLRLQLKNFLSYGPTLQTVDFSPYPLICLSGKNGHGKSALLDAITWAVWGQARKTSGVSKADNGLLHLGQRQILVIFDFMFNGQHYRIRREFSKIYGKDVAAVDFGIINDETQELIALTDKTIKKTQEKIESMLNLDIDSFVNSAFLRQGQSNEFCKKSAKDRKKVLATILGLNRYESIRMLANEKSKYLIQQKNIRTTSQEKRLEEIVKQKEVTQQLKDKVTQLRMLDTQEKKHIKTEEHLNKQLQELYKKKQEKALVVYEREQLHKKEQKLLATIKHEKNVWQKVTTELKDLPDKQALEKRKVTVVHNIKKHQEQLQLSLRIKEELLIIKEQIHKRMITVEQESLQANNKLHISHEQAVLEQAQFTKNNTQLAQEIAEETQAKKECQTAYSRLEKQIQIYRIKHKEHQTLLTQFERRREYYQKFIAQGNYSNQQLQELTKKRTLVHDEENPSCPLCEQNLSASRKRFLKKKFIDSHTFLTSRVQRMKSVITRLKEILVAQHVEITEIKEEARVYERRLVQLEEYTKKIATLTQSIQKKELQAAYNNKQLTGLADTLKKLHAQAGLLKAADKKKSTTDNQLQKLEEKNNALKKEWNTTQYDQGAHKSQEQELKDLESKLVQYQKLTEQKILQEERKKRIADSTQELKEVTKNTAVLTKKIEKYSISEEDIKRITTEIDTNKQEQKTVIEQKELLLQEKGKLEYEQKRIAQTEQEYTQEKKELTKLSRDIDDYFSIVTATGKNGIQALLIEQAIPEIEQEANAILSRLTNNQSQIIIESLRDLKKGGSKETLDIKISDAVGIRPYELFSGGEAFRIDFALRIAISKLLARRSGTSLQTLIIDEGFGSQDEEGLHNIMDALYKIQDDFSKVIIVSHLPAIKDNFPVHFLISKDAQGSKVQIMEQG